MLRLIHSKSSYSVKTESHRNEKYYAKSEKKYNTINSDDERFAVMLKLCIINEDREDEKESCCSQTFKSL